MSSSAAAAGGVVCPHHQSWHLATCESLSDMLINEHVQNMQHCSKAIASPFVTVLHDLFMVPKHWVPVES
jgi:hypothetical protein